jgi:hypothetical protein
MLADVRRPIAAVASHLGEGVEHACRNRAGDTAPQCKRRHDRHHAVPSATFLSAGTRKRRPLAPNLIFQASAHRFRRVKQDAARADVNVVHMLAPAVTKKRKTERRVFFFRFNSEHDPKACPRTRFGVDGGFERIMLQRRIQIIRYDLNRIVVQAMTDRRCRCACSRNRCSEQSGISDRRPIIRRGGPRHQRADTSCSGDTVKEASGLRGRPAAVSIGGRLCSSSMNVTSAPTRASWSGNS